MVADNNSPFEFENEIRGSSLPTDTFLEKLREYLAEKGVCCSQTKEKTGEAKTTGVGMTFGGELGGGIAHSDIITNKWNPFNITASAKKYTFLGKFKGHIKLTEMAKYHKKKKDTHYELRDYNLNGNMDFSPSSFWTFILFGLGVYIGFEFSTGFWWGLGIIFGLISLFYGVAHEVGNTEIDIPQSKIKEGIYQFEKYLQHHNKVTMK